jgi:CRISPR/Cas system-associated exonuclease Cas4 (RecB family)
MNTFPDDYEDFNNEAAELLEEQSPYMTPMKIVSYSEVFKVQTCKRAHYYRFIKGLKPVEESGPILVGNKGHKLLENFYNYLAEGKTKEEARKLVDISAQKMLMHMKATDFSILPAWLLVDNYIRANEFTAKAVLIEKRFLLPARLLSDDPELADVHIGFTPDVVLERTGGFLDVEDYKFVQRAWAKSKLNRYQQSKLYQIFLELMGYNVSRSAIRFFNVKTSTTTDKPYVIKPEERKILIRDFVKGVKEVIAVWRENEAAPDEAPRTMNYTACQYCPFEFACTLEAEGKSAKATFESQFTKSDYDYSS